MALTYVLAGYHLIHLKLVEYGIYPSEQIPTGSACINAPLLDSFSRSWTSAPSIEQQAQEDFPLTTAQIQAIQAWTDEADADERTGFIHLFYTLEAAQDYYQRFFHSMQDVVLLGIYLPLEDAQRLKKDYTPIQPLEGEMGMSVLCGQEIPEEESGVCIGYEPIGVGLGGSFHSMHCYETAFPEIVAHFDLKLNDQLLLSSDQDYPAIIAYFNDEKNGLGHDPWYFAKVKQFPLH